MKLKVERRWPKVTYTIGRLYIDGIFYCNTLEDRDRGLSQTDPLPTIQKRKIAGETAIPKGTYDVLMNVTSPKYAGVAWYYNFCRGKMPRLKDVPGFDGILIHPGGSNGPLDTRGCILVGRNTKVGKLTDSRACFQEIYRLMKQAADQGEKITIEIV
ncbi:MAG: hypothetical protein J6P62_11625 [Bacteroidales bacterium]|nr:hypothetical protein [Bacteroidales bacterium]